MKQHLIIGLFFLMSTYSFAEKIDGPANIRTNPKGIKLVSLFDNVLVDCTELRNNWYQVAISLRINESQYESRIPILKGDTLVNWKNEKIGIALMNIPDSLCFSWTSGGAPGNPKIFGAEIFGFTFKSNIRPESIVENDLVKIIIASNQELNKQLFYKHLEKFNYTDGLNIAEMPEYETLMVYENIIDDPSPIDRVRLIFEENQLVAIVHSRVLNLNYETVNIDRNRMLTIIQKMDSEKKKRFIAMNNKSYWGVD
ncbi:MAG: hypothetical protein MI866_01960 [Bacteroidales bacterium]|nr:hypothetical protein [Bacteroidales bacterium]